MANHDDLLKQIESMSVLELSEFVKALEEKFGVSAAAFAAPVAAPVEEGVKEEKDNFSVVLTDAGSSKIQVIKAIKDITGKGLKESKDLVDGAPVTIKEGVKKEEAEEMKNKLQTAGASVELK